MLDHELSSQQEQFQDTCLKKHYISGIDVNQQPHACFCNVDLPRLWWRYYLQSGTLNPMRTLDWSILKASRCFILIRRDLLELCLQDCFEFRPLVPMFR